MTGLGCVNRRRRCSDGLRLKPLTPEQVASAEQALANAKTAYCAIPEADRAAFRAKHGLPLLVTCP